jgi:amino acid transporter
MAVTETPVLPSVRHRPGLRREIGFIGLLWASAGSIIGSGWLFGAQSALSTAGPAAIISWGIGAVAILLLALVHAELGGMYPVAGGTARFPHYAFGGAVGASFGWFSWLQAAALHRGRRLRANLATLLGLGWLATILYIDAVISPGGTGLIYTTATSRVSYGLSRNGYVPSIYERTDRRGIPWFGLLTAFVVGCVCFLPFPSWKSLVGLITSASVLMYAGAPLALATFRRRLPEADRPYRAPAAAVLTPAAFAVANLLILWSGWKTDYKLGIAILIGYAILAANRLFKLNPLTPVLDLRAATWLPVYLIGMGLIVYLSDFGPLKNPVFPLWWDMLAVAAFSLIIFFWALHVALPRERIEATIEQSVADEPPELAVA